MPNSSLLFGYAFFAALFFSGPQASGLEKEGVYDLWHDAAARISMEGNFAVSTSKSTVFKDGRVEASAEEFDNQKAILSAKKGYFVLRGDPSNAAPKLVVLSNPKYSAILNRNAPNGLWNVAEFCDGNYDECFTKMQGLQQSLIYIKPAEYLIFQPLAPIGKLRDCRDFKIVNMSRIGGVELINFESKFTIQGQTISSKGTIHQSADVPSLPALFEIIHRGNRRASVSKEYDPEHGYCTKMQTTKQFDDYSVLETVNVRKLDSAILPDEHFRLTAYQLPEPVGVTWDKPTPRYLWWIIGVGVCALIAFFCRFAVYRINRAHRSAAI